MIVKRFYDETLAQASYLIGCGRTGNSIVIDPTRDIDQYLRMAEAEEVAITQVTETHIHDRLLVRGTRARGEDPHGAGIPGRVCGADTQRGRCADRRRGTDHRVGPGQ